MRSSFLDYAMSRHRLARAARRARRAEAGAPPRPLRDVDEPATARPPVREVRERRRLRDGQPPPARRRVDLRHARPHGAALLAALSARRRPGQLRLDRRRSGRRRCATASPATRGSATPAGTVRIDATRPAAQPESDTRRRPRSARPARPPGPRVEALPLRRPPDAAVAHARGLRARRARTIIRCSASSTWPACRCFSGSCSKRSSPATAFCIARTPRADDGPLGAASGRTALLLGAFVSEGCVSETRAGFNNVDREFFDAVVDAYDARRRRPALRLRAHDRSGQPALRARRAQPRRVWSASPLAELVGLRSAQKRVPERVWRGAQRVQARLPAGALHRRRLVVAAAAQDDPGLVLDVQRAAREGRPAAAARVRRRQRGFAATRRARSRS